MLATGNPLQQGGQRPPAPHLHQQLGRPADAKGGQPRERRSDLDRQAGDRSQLAGQGQRGATRFAGGGKGAAACLISSLDSVSRDMQTREGFQTTGTDLV